MDVKGDALQTVQVTKIWPHRKMVTIQTRIFQENKTGQILWNYEIQTGHPIPTRPPCYKQEEINVLSSEKQDEFLDLSTELKTNLVW